MTIFYAPLFVGLVALAIYARLAYLQAHERPVPSGLRSGLYSVVTATGFSLALACYQAGLWN